MRQNLYKLPFSSIFKPIYIIENGRENQDNLILRPKFCKSHNLIFPAMPKAKHPANVVEILCS